MMESIKQHLLSAKNSPPRRPWRSGILRPAQNFARSPNLRSKMVQNLKKTQKLEKNVFKIFKEKKKNPKFQKISKLEKGLNDITKQLENLRRKA